jgi:2-polyprenyl-6-methoxyphenol hydroxylase-like FAD-dependent oxidoreductase
VGQPRKRIAIIGGGFSGAMLAARLAEAGVPSSLIDRSGVFAPRRLYGEYLQHRLNAVRLAIPA